MAYEVCESCGYNLPHHDSRCRHAAPLHYLCRDHRPGRASNTDDATIRHACEVCGTATVHGYR